MKTTSELSVGLLGPEIDHKNSLTAMLNGRLRELSWIPDSNSFLKKKLGTPSRLTRLRQKWDRLTHTRDPDYLKMVCQAIDTHHIDVLLSYWGTEPLPDLLAIRKLRPQVRLVLMVLCYPVALAPLGIARQNWMMKRACHVLDGIIFPNEAMATYFQQQGLLSAQPPASLVMPPAWPRSYQAGQDAPPPAASDQPNVIFIGRTDLSHSTVHAADDLRPVMRQLLDAGIGLHHVQSPETNDGHPLRKPFAPLDQRGLIAFMPTHDASLMAYNTQACARDDRFHLTVPDRLITSVAAGVPIAIPRQGYEGAKQYLVDYPAVIEFDDARDLQHQLSDRPRLARLRQQAFEARVRYTAESRSELLAGFIARLR